MSNTRIAAAAVAINEPNEQTAIESRFDLTIRKKVTVVAMATTVTSFDQL